MFNQVKHQDPVKETAPKGEQLGIGQANPSLAPILDETVRHASSDGGVIDTVDLHAQIETVSKDLASATANVQDLHPGGELRDLEGLGQATREMPPLTGDELLVTFTSGQIVGFIVAVSFDGSFTTIGIQFGLTVRGSAPVVMLKIIVCGLPGVKQALAIVQRPSDGGLVEEDA
jgi:hypothetical protein